MKNTVFLIAITLFTSTLFAQEKASNMILFDRYGNKVLEKKLLTIPKNFTTLNFIDKNDTKDLKEGTYYYLIQSEGKKDITGFTYKGSDESKEAIVVSNNKTITNEISFYTSEGKSAKTVIKDKKTATVQLKRGVSPSENAELYINGKKSSFKKGKKAFAESEFLDAVVEDFHFSKGNYQKNVIMIKVGGKNHKKSGNLMFKGKNKPVIYINNKKQSDSYDLSEISPDSIESISVLKGKKHSKGAIYIVTKQKSKKPIIYINGKKTDEKIEDVNIKTIKSIEIVKTKKAAFKLGIPFNENGVIYIKTK